MKFYVTRSEVLFQEMYSNNHHFHYDDQGGVDISTNDAKYPSIFISDKKDNIIDEIDCLISYCNVEGVVLSPHVNSRISACR